MKSSLTTVWYESRGSWSWEISIADEPVFLPDGLDVLMSVLPDHLGDWEKYREAVAHNSGVTEQGSAIGGNGVGACLKDGVYVVENDYLDEYKAHISPEEFLRLLEWRIAIMKSADFTNPNATFEPIEIEYEAVPVGGC